MKGLGLEDVMGGLTHLPQNQAPLNAFPDISNLWLSQNTWRVRKGRVSHSTAPAGTSNGILSLAEFVPQTGNVRLVGAFGTDGIFATNNATQTFAAPLTMALPDALHSGDRVRFAQYGNHLYWVDGRHSAKKAFNLGLWTSATSNPIVDAARLAVGDINGLAHSPTGAYVEQVWVTALKTAGGYAGGKIETYDPAGSYVFTYDDAALQGTTGGVTTYRAVSCIPVEGDCVYALLYLVAGDVGNTIVALKWDGTGAYPARAILTAADAGAAEALDFILNSATGNFWILSAGTLTIRTTAGVAVTGTLASPAATVDGSPMKAMVAMCQDSSGNVYVANNDHHSIVKFSPTGLLVTEFGQEVLGTLLGVCMNYDGTRVLVSDNSLRVHVFDLDGNYKGSEARHSSATASATKAGMVSLASFWACYVAAKATGGTNTHVDKIARTAAAESVVSSVAQPPKPLQGPSAGVYAVLGGTAFAAGEYAFYTSYVKRNGEDAIEGALSVAGTVTLPAGQDAVVVDGPLDAGCATGDSIRFYVKGPSSEDTLLVREIYRTASTTSASITFRGWELALCEARDDSGTAPPDACTILLRWKDRMVYIGPAPGEAAAAPADTVYLSNTTDADRVPLQEPEQRDASHGTYIRVLNNGTSFKAAAVVGSYLAVWGERSLWLINENNGWFTCDNVSNQVGCVSHESVAEVNGARWFLAQDGVYAFDGNAAPVSVGLPISKKLAALTPAQKAASFAVFDAEADHRLYMLFVPPTAAATNVPAGVAFVFDAKDRQKPYWTYWDGLPDACAIYSTRSASPGIYAGDRYGTAAAGILYLLHKTDAAGNAAVWADCGVAITFSVKTREFQEPYRGHYMDVPRVALQAVTGASFFKPLTFSLYTNGSGSAAATKTLSSTPAPRLLEWFPDCLTDAYSYQIGVSGSADHEAEFAFLEWDVSDRGAVV